MDLRLQSLAALIGLLVGCVGYKPGVTVDDVAASRRPGPKLARYLAQTSADAAVCDVRRRDGAAIGLVTGATATAIGRAFARGAIPPEGWRACSLLLWSGATPLAGGGLDAELARRVRGDVLDPDATWDAAVRARAAAVLDVLELREAPAPLAPGVVDRLARTPVAGELGARLADLLDLERGLHRGRPVDAATIAATTDAGLLAAWARRLPSADLRGVAGERLLDLRLQRLPAERRPEARAAVLAAGRWEVPASAAVLSARWEPREDDTVLLRVLQDPPRPTVRLLPAARDGTRSPDPSVDLRGALVLLVDGFDDPVDLCPPADRWDPTPCYPPERLRMTHAVAVLAPTGRVRFPTELALDDLLRLGADGDHLAAQVVAGGAVADLDLPIRFDSVPPYVFIAGWRSSVGSVVQHGRVWELSHERLLIELDGTFRKWRMVVPFDDAAFGVECTAEPSQVCPTVELTMRCTHCGAVRATLERMVRSDGDVRIRRAGK